MWKAWLFWFSKESDSCLALKWYGLVGQEEIILTVWLRIQVDEAFLEAWLSDAHDINHHDLVST